MSRKTLVNVVLALLLIAALGSAIGLTVHYTRLPEYQTDHNLLIYGQSSLTPGTQAGLRLVAQNAYTRASLADVDFTVSMRPAAGGEAVVLFTGKTGPDGSANINFKVPESADPNQILRVESHSAANTSQVERPVTLKRDYRLLLSTDKPIYQPGQIIHLRLLALSVMDLAPADAQELELTIADGKGNRVMRQTVQTSEYGVASLDFQLASEVNSGNYKITATLNNTASEKTVTVEPYVLPKFKLAFAADKTFYLPGETVKGTLDAAYFFGKPVSGSEVTLEVFSYDVQKNVVASLQGKTDELGRFTFSFDLPGYLTGSEWDQGRGRVYLEAMITDQANHSEAGQYSLPVSQQPLVIQAIPEGGVVRPGQATSIYVMTSYPDGTPASASIKLADGDEPVQTGPYGIATLADPQGRESVTITAQDDRGNQAAQTFVFSANYNSGGVVLRTDKPIYRVGDTMKITIYSGNSQSVYLDIIRNGQTVSTRAMTPAQGKADDAVDLTPDLWGTLELHAYFLDKYGSIYRDTRLVVVDQANELAVTLTPKNDSYRPGDTAQVDVQVNDDQGNGLQAALGLAVVDEAVFALAQQDPGFARLYFMLEEELMTPKVDLHDYSFQDLVGERPTNPQLEKAANLAAEASLASAAGDLLLRSGQIHSLVANSWAETSQKVYQQQRDFFSRASGILLIGFLLIPIGIVTLAVIDLRRQKVFGRSLGTALAALACFFLAGWVLSILSTGRPFDSPLNFLGDLMDTISRQNEPVLLGFLLLTLAGFIALVVIAVVRKEPLLGWSMGLLAAYILTGGLLVYSISASSLSTPPDWVIIAVLIAFLLTPLVFLVRTMGFVFQKRTAAVLACLPVALFMTVGFLPLLMVAGSGVMASGQNLDMRNMANGAVMVEEVMMEKAVMAPLPTAVPAAIQDGAEHKENEQGQASAAPRLRQYFPETLLWLPDLITDDHGTIQVDIPVADSITTWRMTALASSKDGRLGSVNAPLKVFQPFFVDIDLPLALTVGDEIAIPIGIFNYLDESQTIELTVEPQPWFELLDEPVKTLTLQANDVSADSFRIRVLEWGYQPFKVTAIGEASDAIQKMVQVVPNGKPLSFSQSDRLIAGEPVNQTLTFPKEAIAGTPKVMVKIYPGVISQIVEGLDSILRMPNGCFEQTSSSNYPNLLVLDYLKTTGNMSPEVQMKAESYINTGYQRLLTFEVQGGGFSLFGDAPADRMLTAYGLLEFSDMSRVHDVDQAVIERAARWLLSQQQSDGSWENDRGLVHEQSLSSLNDKTPVTAYIVWGLVQAGYELETSTQLGVDYVREHATDLKDPYALALAANALVAYDNKTSGRMDGSTQKILDNLAGLVKMEGQSAYWRSDVATFMGSQGQTGSIETTALAAIAFMRSGTHLDLGNAALTYLVQQKDEFGTWYNTQATVLSLTALLESMKAGRDAADATLKISLNGGQTREIKVDAGNGDIVQFVSFDDISLGVENQVEINMDGEGSLMYQITGSFYLPWEKLASYPQFTVDPQMSVEVTYDRTVLSVDDTVTVKVKVALTEKGSFAQSAMVDLGVPPGFEVLSEDLSALVEEYNGVQIEGSSQATFQRYGLTGRQVIVYLTNLVEGQPFTFSYRLRAKYPLKAQIPASSAYDYYNPEVNGEAAPQVVVVK